MFHINKVGSTPKAKSSYKNVYDASPTFGISYIKNSQF